MKNKGIWVVVSVVVVLGLLIGSFGCAGPSPQTSSSTTSATPAGQVIKWKMQTTYTMESAVTQSGKDWITAMDKITGGRLKVELFPPNTFGAAADTLPTLAQGVVDAMVSCGPYYEGTFAPGGAEMGVPMGWMSHAEVWDAMYKYGMIDVLREAYAQQGVYYAGVNFTDTYYNFCTTFPMTSLNDIKGKKIRALGNYGKYVAALGGAPTTIPGPELYMAMKLKTVDGAIYGMSGQYDVKLAEVTQTYVFPTSGNPDSNILISMKSYNALPDDIKHIVGEATIYTQGWSSYSYHQFCEMAWRYAQKQGVKAYNMTPEEIQRAVKACVPIWDEVAALNPVNAKIIDIIKRQNQEYGRI